MDVIDKDDDWNIEFSELCFSLSMDEVTKTDALKKYTYAQSAFNFDGKPIHWLACAIYDSCFSRKLVTIAGETQRGNYLSFTQLLKSIGLSFEDFWKCLDTWQITANRNDDFRIHVDKLRRKWVVTSHIYNKYKQIFENICKTVPDTNFKIKRKARREISSIELYKFVWTFYCYIKANFPQSIEDVMSSSQLLLAVADYCFGEVYHSEPHLLSEDGRNAFRQSENVSIIERLCEDFLNRLGSTEAKRIRDYHLKPLIKQFFIQGILKAAGEDDKGILDWSVFDSNVKSVTNEYDTYILKQGEYDNRLFLDNVTRSRPLGDRTPTKNTTISRTPSDQSNRVKKNLLKDFEESMIPKTPLSNKNYLPKTDDIQRTPISEQADILNRLNNLIINYGMQPSQILENILKRFAPPIRKDILDIQVSLSDKFIKAYCNGEENALDFARQRLEHGTRLFYRIFEFIISSEARRYADIALEKIVSNPAIVSAVFAMSVEIVLNTYGSTEQKFPWILAALKLHPFHVYKVIELIIMNDTGLSRTIIKHLNMIEETMLETMVWKRDSPHYGMLASCNPPRPPRYEDVKPRGNQTPNWRANQDDIRNQRCGGIVVGADKRRGLLSLNPLNSTVSPFEQMERVAVPVQPAPLFRVVVPCLAPDSEMPTTSNMREGAQTPVTALANCVTTLGVMSPPPRPILPKSLIMFFRKVYNLVYVRMKCLAEKLELSKEVLQQIWTVFEHAITHHLHLFYNRHIDQILICSTYLIIKAANLGVTFRKIIEKYRQQPQVQQYIYRNVLLFTEPFSSPSLMCECSSKPATPNGLNPEKGDIIKFYNTVFVNHISSFIKPADNQSNRLDLATTLSPMPIMYTHLQGGEAFSPRHIDSHNIHVSPKKNNVKPYIIGQSPTKDLDEMNRSIQNAKPKRALFVNEAQKKSEKVKKSAMLMKYDN